MGTVTIKIFGYYQNKKANYYDLYLQYKFFLGMSGYKIEEEIDGIYKAVLNSVLLL